MASEWTVPRDPDKPRILLCAPSNTAVDELAYRILTTQGVLDVDGNRDERLNIVRIGHPCREEYMRRQHGIGGGGYQHQKQGQGQALSLQDEAVIRVVERVSLENIVEARRRALQQLQSSYPQDVPGMGTGGFKAADLRRQVLDRADIVLCTLSGAGSQPILEVSFVFMFVFRII